MAHCLLCERFESADESGRARILRDLDAFDPDDRLLQTFYPIGGKTYLKREVWVHYRRRRGETQMWGEAVNLEAIDEASTDE